MAAYSFNPEPIITYVERQATKAVMNATAIAVKHAQRHAPVRKLFKGTSYGTTKGGFRAPKIRRVSDIDSGVTRAGHANSLFPVLRMKRGGQTSFISGDFRRVGGGEREYRFGGETYERGSQRLAKIGTGYKPGNIGESSGSPEMFGRLKGTQPMVPGSTQPGQLAVFKVRGGRASLQDPATLKPVSGEELRIGKGAALTSRGRFEVRSGRANFKSPDDGITRVGGRLRGEIHAEGPVTAQGIIWGYVVSATKDPETGTFYPFFQEFGSAHNRPHPFLRPGLQDSRGALKREVRDAVRRGPKQQPK